MGRTTDTPVTAAVRELVAPIVADLGLDLYDIEQRGGTLRITIDTPPGSEGGVDLDTIALATRLISRDLDHHDPVPGRYTLEVTSPGVERTLRTPAHFRREIGKTLSIRLADVEAAERRLEGVLVAADDTTATIRITTGDDMNDGMDDDVVERVVALDRIDRAKTVFEWGPQPKRGGKGAPGGKKARSAKNRAATKTSAGAQRRHDAARAAEQVTPSPTRKEST